MEIGGEKHTSVNLKSFNKNMQHTNSEKKLDIQYIHTEQYFYPKMLRATASIAEGKKLALFIDSQYM